jgi:hypothetical protein
MTLDKRSRQTDTKMTVDEHKLIGGGHWKIANDKQMHG